MNTELINSVGATFAILSFVILIIQSIILVIERKRSEERLHNANLMVQQCTEAVKELSHTATVNMEIFDRMNNTSVTQICNLQKQRDELTAQNHDLIRTNAELTSILSLKKDQTINFNAKEK